MLRNVEGYLQNITVPINVITTITDFKDFIILQVIFKDLKIYDYDHGNLVTLSFRVGHRILNQHMDSIHKQQFLF